MKIKTKKESEVIMDVPVPSYWKSGIAYYMVVSEDICMSVFSPVHEMRNAALNIARPSTFIDANCVQITESEFRHEYAKVVDYYDSLIKQEATVTIYEPAKKEIITY